MSAYPTLDPAKRYVLRRKRDGKYLEVWGWGIEWADNPSHACPFFTSINLSAKRPTDFHLNLYRRFRTVKAHVNGMTCELTPFTP